MSVNFAFTEEQQELRAAARAFLAEASSSERVRAAMASELGYDPEVWKRIGSELGWPAAIVPEDCGGLGLGAVELVALAEAMGEALLCSPFFATVCLAAQAVLAAGSDGAAPALARADRRGSGARGARDAPSPASRTTRWRSRRAARATAIASTARKRYAIDGAQRGLARGERARAGQRAATTAISLFVVPGDARRARAPRAADDGP